MSEYLGNKEHKREILKRLIKDLHNGRDPEEVKREFSELVEGVEAGEIAEMEQQLIDEGMPSKEIKRLCDVHAAVFKESLMKNKPPELIPGHPLHTLKHENDEAKKTLAKIESLVERIFEADGGKESPDLLDKLLDEINHFRQNIDRHYSKKENIFFPYLEKHNITGPPSVMWSVDDEIRDMFKNFTGRITELKFDNAKETFKKVKDDFLKVKDKVVEMFFKEDNILTPMLKDTLAEEEWAEIKEQEADFGPVFSSPEQDYWQPQQAAAVPGYKAGKDDALELDTGELTAGEINAILTNLTVDITFVDKNDVVKYFSQGKERIFTRTRAIIGRKVQNCHPPESVHMVERIVNDFKTGKHDTAEFWLTLNGTFIYIRYVALRDNNGEYLGTMEISQNLNGPRALQGERRLLQYSD